VGGRAGGSGCTGRQNLPPRTIGGLHRVVGGSCSRQVAGRDAPRLAVSGQVAAMSRSAGSGLGQQPGRSGLLLRCGSVRPSCAHRPGYAGATGAVRSCRWSKRSAVGRSARSGTAPCSRLVQRLRCARQASWAAAAAPYGGHGQCRYVDGDARAFEQAAAVGTRVADHTLWDGRGLRQLFDGHAATAGCRGRWLTRCSRCWLAGVSTRYRSGSPAGGSSPLPWLQT